MTHSIPQAHRRNPLALAVLSTLTLLTPISASSVYAAELEEVVVTAQKRAIGLQDTALSISAFSGDTLERANVFNAGDLANSTAGLSFTNPTPFDMELNIRGVMNTRLDAPSASRSVGVFMDEVVVGRMGLMSMDFYDIERVEILRGPQGVLLGKNVVGGAINVITAKPDFDTTASLKGSVGNLNAKLLNGHFTAGITDNLAVRVAAQYRKNDGFAEDFITERDLHNIESKQARLSFLYQNDSGFRGNLIFEYLEDEGNGTCAVGENGNPWAIARGVAGITDIRECAPEPVQYSTIPGDSLQFYDREATSLTLKLEKDFSQSTLTAITGYRDGNGESQYSQTGLGPDAPNVQDTFFAAFNDFVNSGFTDQAALGTVVNMGLAFDFPVREKEDLQQFSQELRLVSNYDDSRFDWIVGGYYQLDKIEKNDIFWGENLVDLVDDGGALNGESMWDNESETESYAAFAQVGFRILDSLKLTLGGRYTEDEVDGHVDAVANVLGDKFSPGDMIPIVPLTGEPDGMGGLIPYGQGEGYSTDYGETWSESTLQGILEWEVNDDVMLYASVSQGYKSGGFQDTPPNTFGAITPYEPETVLSYELGIKSELWDNRMRVNGAIFSMDYQDLQVEFTNDVCLCNIVSNASDASINGAELEVQLAASDSLYVWFSGSYVDGQYEDYIISTGDFSGNQMQRTPETQISTGFEYNLGTGDWENAFLIRLAYTWQDEMPWAHTNVSWEEDYGLLDGRLAFSPPGQSFTVAAWGKNLTDEEVRANVIEFLGGDMSLYTPPRTYGLEFTYDF